MDIQKRAFWLFTW